MSRVAFRNFTGGETTPTLCARYDLKKFGTFLQTCRNFVPNLHGDVERRPGTKYIADLGANSILIPFQFNTDPSNNYVLIFQSGTIKIAKADGLLVATMSNPYNMSHVYGSQNNFPPTVIHGLLEVRRSKQIIFQTLYRISVNRFTETHRRYLNLASGTTWTKWLRIDNGATLDSHDIKYKGAGYITTSKTQVCFTVPLFFNPANCSISVSGPYLDARQNGSYVVNGDISGTGFSISVVIEESGLKFTVTSTTELTCTNNEACGIDFYCTLMLS